MWFTYIILFFLGLGLNLINLLIFKFINIFFISNFFFFDSLINLNILIFFYFLTKKLLIGKKFNQISILKKTLYLIYLISLKKYKIFSRLKCGDINFFSRISNEIIFVYSNKIFFYIFTSFSTFFYSLNIFNFFLTYRFNFSNIIFVTYLNFLNIFKFFYCFLNKIIIYYMINNNYLYFFNNLKFLKIFYIFFLESSNYYTECFYFFNLNEIFFNFLNNFLFFKNPKYLIINNFFNLINLNNFFLFL